MSNESTPFSLGIEAYDGHSHTMAFTARPRIAAGDTNPESVPHQRTNNPESTEAQGINVEGVSEDLIAHTFEVLEEMRQRQNNMTPGDSIDDQVDNFLQTRVGLAPDAPGYSGLRELSRKASIDNYSDLQWHYSPVKPDGTTQPSGRDQTRQSIVELFAQNTVQEAAATTATVQAAAPEQAALAPQTGETVRAHMNARERHEFNEAVEELDNLREELATLHAKQLGRLFGPTGKFDKARAEYNDALRRVGQLEEQVRNKADSSRSDEQKNVDFVQYIMDEQTKLREMTRERFARGNANSFIEWFGRGGRMKRIAKGVALGVPLAVAGSTIVPAASAIAGYTAGLVVASRYARNHAPSQEAINEDDLKQHLAEQGVTLDNAITYADSKLENDRKLEQKKHRKATIRTLGAISVTATMMSLS